MRITSRVRLVTGALAVGLVTALVPVAAQSFYADYENALKAIENEQWQRAESLLKSALKRNANQGRGVFTYGTGPRIDYFPEDYLALVYTRLNRTEEAVELFAKVKKLDLLGPMRNESKALRTFSTQTRASLDTAIAKRDEGRGSGNGRGLNNSGGTSDAGRGDGVAGGGSAGGGGAGRGAEDPATIAARAAEERRVRAEALVTQAGRDITAGRFDTARDALGEARKLGLEESRIAPVERHLMIAGAEAQLNAAVTARTWSEAEKRAAALRALDPTNRVAAAHDRAIAGGLATLTLRDGMRAFLNGNYHGAITLLNAVPPELPASTRALWYLACSNAAIAMLEGPGGASRLKQAREWYARAQAQAGPNAFAVDRRYVSPQILKVLSAKG